MRRSPHWKHDLQLGMTGLPVRYDVSFNDDQQLSASTFTHCHVAAPRSGHLLGMRNHVVIRCTRIAAGEDDVNLGFVRRDGRK
jgi:hypothetical protein